MEQRSLRALEFNGRLSGDERFTFLQLGMLLVAETVLQFDLEVIGESIAKGGVGNDKFQINAGAAYQEWNGRVPTPDSLIAPRRFSARNRGSVPNKGSKK